MKKVLAYYVRYAFAYSGNQEFDFNTLDEAVKFIQKSYAEITDWRKNDLWYAYLLEESEIEKDLLEIRELDKMEYFKYPFLQCEIEKVTYLE